MKATVKMIAKMQEMGIAKLWQKNGYNRLYIDLEKANEIYRDNDDLAGQLAMNRRDRGNGKLWVEMDSNEICTKALSSGDEVAEQIIELANYYIAIDESAETAETAETSENTINDREIYDLCKENAITLTKDGNLAVAHAACAEVINKIKKHKNEIVGALSGYCFSRDVYTGSALGNWQITKCSTIGDVQYPPVKVFEGTASEVDAWAKAHQDDPYFTDHYTSKYKYIRVDK